MWTAGPRLDYNLDPVGGTLPAAFNTELYAQKSATLADLEYYTRWDRTNTIRAGQVFETGLQTTSLNGIADSVLAFLANLRSDAQAQLDAVVAAAQALAARVTTAETGLTGLVSRLLRWSFDGPTDTVSITSARTVLQAASVASLNGASTTQLSYLAQLTAPVESRLQAAAASILDLTTRMGQAETGLTSLVTRLLRWSFDGPTDTVTITSARTSLQATTVTSLNTITATQLSYLTGLSAGVETRLVGAAASIADLVARLTRWTYSAGSDAVAITSASVSLPATTVSSLNTITAAQLGYLTGLTASVETRLVANAASITALVNRLLRWTYTAATDAVAITSATVSLPATAATSLATASLAATEAAAQNVTGTRVSARTLWAEQVQCARLQVSSPPWPIAYLFNGQGMWPLLATRTTAGLGLDVVLPVRVSVSPGWMLRFERADGALVAMVDARGQADWVHQVSLTFTTLPPRIILGR